MAQNEFNPKLRNPAPWLSPEFKKRLYDSDHKDIQPLLTQSQRQVIYAGLPQGRLDGVFSGIERWMKHEELFVDWDKLEFPPFSIGSDKLPSFVHILAQPLLNSIAGRPVEGTVASYGGVISILLPEFPSKGEIIEHFIANGDFMKELKVYYHELVHYRLYVNESVGGERKLNIRQKVLTETHAQYVDLLDDEEGLKYIFDILTSKKGYGYPDDFVREAITIIRTMKAQGFRDREIADSITLNADRLSNGFEAFTDLIKQRWKLLGKNNFISRRGVIKNYGRFLDWRMKRLRRVCDQKLADSSEVFVKSNEMTQGSGLFVRDNRLPKHIQQGSDGICEITSSGTFKAYLFNKLDGFGRQTKRRLLEIVMFMPQYSFDYMVQSHPGNKQVRDWETMRKERFQDRSLS